jgi:hypothetical protein
MATPGSFLSSPRDPSDRPSPLPWIAAGVVAVALLAGLWIAGHRSRSERQTADQAAVSARPDAYAARLSLSGLEMSEASNFAGSKVTYVDGTIRNTGDRAVTGVQVVVTFHAAGGDPPVERAMPLMLIRTRDPYVDIEPVSADPIRPGASREFRLIFDTVPEDWDQKHPEIRVTRVATQ